MSIELIIRGNHTTDVLAELQTLAAALGPQQGVAPTQQPPAGEAFIESSTVATKPVTEEKPKAEKPKTTRKPRGKKAEKVKPVSDETEGEEAEEVINADSIRDKMAELSKDENGTPDQDMLVKIREVLGGFVPQGQAVKIANIPEDKFGDVYAALEALKGDAEADDDNVDDMF